MAFVSGPRQSGKTTFAKALLKERGFGRYYNWDDIEFRRQWVKSPRLIVPRAEGEKTPILVLDEIHKAKLWKRSLKGVFDTLEAPVDIIVTGSARLDIYQKGGDSLMGRYFPFRLHPFSVAEMIHRKATSPDELINAIKTRSLSASKEATSALETLQRFGGFPEPLFSQSEKVARAWRRTRQEQLIREDLRDISRIPELSQIEMLAALLPERVGSVLSRAALREDLEVAHTTVSRWLSFLERLYFFFEIKPYSKKIRNSIKKEGKLYFWEYSDVPTPGARLENLVAAHLLKACHYWTDSGEGLFELFYLRNKQGYEIDFLITKDKKPFLPIEAKSTDTQIANGWKIFLPQIKTDIAVQLTTKPGISQVTDVGGTNIFILSMDRFLVGLI